MKICTFVLFLSLSTVLLAATPPEVPQTRYASTYLEACGLDCSDLELLQFAVDAATSEGAILHVDDVYVLDGTLELPKGAYLRGDGLFGGPTGTLHFAPTESDLAMIVIDPDSEGKSDVIIEGLFLENLDTAPNARAIDVSFHSSIHIRGLQIANFRIGIAGSESLSVWIDDCIVRNSTESNIRVGSGANAWRIRGGILSQARYGVFIEGGFDTLVQSVRMESNTTAAVWVAGNDTHLSNNYFERNGDFSRLAVYVDFEVTDTMLVGNYYGTNGTFDEDDDQRLEDCGRDTVVLDPRQVFRIASDLKVQGTIEAENGITLGRTGPKICGGPGSPPNTHSADCDQINGSIYLQRSAGGAMHFMTQGTWKRMGNQE